MTVITPDKKPPVKKRSSSGSTVYSGRMFRKVFLVLIFLLAQLMFFYSDFFKLKEIRVFGNNRVSAEEIIKTANIPVDRNIVTLPLGESKKRLERIHWLKDTNLRWSVPGQVAIYVEERIPAMLASNLKNPSDWYICDDQGMVLYKARSHEMGRFPRMAIEEDIEIGKTITPDKVMTVKDINSQISDDLRKNVQYFFVDERLEITLFLQEDDKKYNIKFGKVRDVQQKLKTMNAILELVKEKGVKVEYIDVRFREPILKPVGFEPKEKVKPDEE